MAVTNVTYTEESIKSLDWKEHIRLRPGMYIGKLGDGSAQDDGIYVLVFLALCCLIFIQEKYMINNENIDLISYSKLN